MKMRVVVLLLCSLLGWTSGAWASLSDQRIEFQSVLSQIKRGNFKGIPAARRNLASYPLAPYLDYYALSYQPDITRISEVQHYVSRYRGSFMASRLTESYAFLLMQNNMWETYLELQPTEPQSMTLKCAWYLSQFQTGKKVESTNFARKIWFYGHSRPATCDDLFALWHAAGGMTDEDIWQRMVLAFKADDLRLMNHLSGQMSSSDGQYYASKMISVYTNPSQFQTLIAPNNDQKTRDLASLALQRWADTSTDSVLANYMAVKARYHLTETDLVAVKTRIARDMMLDRLQSSRAWLDNTLLLLKDNSLLELRVRLALSEQDWPGVKKWINIMPRAGRDDTRWAYWLARAEQQTGNQEHAQALFKEASYYRSFYGFMAAVQSGTPITIQEDPLQPAYTWDQAARHWPALARIEELLAIDESVMAQREWLFLLDQSSFQNKLQLGLVAQRRGWAYLGIQASIRAKAKDALSLRFPTPNQSLFLRYAEDRDVDPGLLYALARQESALYSGAMSPVGAVGLMQLMPATAAHTAQKIGDPAPTIGQLVNPEVNVRLGSAYIKSLLDQYSGNRILAAAAYNAGPGRVRKWLAQSDNMPADLWVENIPFKETRNYVQNVMVFNAIYQGRLKRPIVFLTDAEKQQQY